MSSQWVSKNAHRSPDVRLDAKLKTTDYDGSVVPASALRALVQAKAADTRREVRG